jgi:hypothetical protein
MPVVPDVWRRHVHRSAVARVAPTDNLSLVRGEGQGTFPSLFARAATGDYCFITLEEHLEPSAEKCEPARRPAITVSLHLKRPLGRVPWHNRCDRYTEIVGRRSPGAWRRCSLSAMMEETCRGHPRRRATRVVYSHNNVGMDSDRSIRSNTPGGSVQPAG